MNPIDRMTHGPNRRTARVALVLFVVFALAAFMLPGGIGSAIAQSPSPSDSPSESPTSTPEPTGPAIQFLNPSGHSNIVSAKNDGTDTSYHITAWAREAPENATVEFKFQAEGENEVAIGNGARPAEDTFEIFWNLSNVDDGTYMLKAIMFSGGVELGRDEEEISVENSDTPVVAPQAEAAEITYPPNGGTFGLYVPVAGPATTAVDVTSSVANAPPSTSTGTTSVRAYYTVTAAGSEPTWTTCGTESKANSANGVRCTLDAADSHSAVTAVAVVPSFAPAQAGFVEQLIGSGDAHRVFPYSQEPTGVSFQPSSHTKQINTCSDPIIATVVDQVSRKVVGANVDVHAKGPSDNLLFDDHDASGNQSSGSQAPDKAHGATESSWDCEDTGFSGVQGQHELPAADPDIKHIESGTAGTNDAGQWTFILLSADAGNTEFVLFADADEDDLFCSAEGNGAGNMTWSSSAPASPTGSASPSGSPTSNPASSPTQGGGSSGIKPETSTCPRPTPTQSGPAANRTVSLLASKGKVKAGRSVTLSGRIEADDSDCQDDELVEIRRRIHGKQQFKLFKTLATKTNGSFQTGMRPRKSADYQVIAPEHDACDQASSTAVSVLVKVVVTVKVSDTTPPGGSRLTFRGKVKPPHKGTKVTLQRKKGKKWVKVAKDNLNARSRYAITIVANWSGKRVFRVKWPRQHQDHHAGTSRRLRVTAV